VGFGLLRQSALIADAVKTPHPQSLTIFCVGKVLIHPLTGGYANVTVKYGEFGKETVKNLIPVFPAAKAKPAGADLYFQWLPPPPAPWCRKGLREVDKGLLRD